MAKRKKSRKLDLTLKIVVLLTAALELLTKLIELIGKLTE